MKKSKLILVAGVISLGLSACGEDAGTASGSLQMALGNGTLGKAAPSGVSAAAANPLSFTDGQNTFTIETARMHIRDVRFDNADGSQVTVAGPFVMDLITNTGTPDIPKFELTDGVYNRVDIRLDEANIGDNLLLAGDTLLGNALVVTGTHTLDPQGTFTLTVRVTEDIRFEPVGGFIVDSAVGANVQLVYNVTDWLENPDSLGTPVDLTTCITTNTLMDAVTKHIALNEGTQCGQSKSIGNIIKDNMKNKYDVSNS